jgi:hypothetical protein
MAGKRRSYKHRGGYSSASSYVQSVVGSGDDQYNRVLGQNGSSSNVITNINGQKAGSRRRRTRRARRSRKGGCWGSIINQAIVPFSLLGMQQSYSRKRQGGRKGTRRY